MNEIGKEVKVEGIDAEEERIKRFYTEITRVFKQISEERENPKPENQPIVKTENLTFLDGVLVTWNIFNKILDKRLRDENGDPKKGVCNGHEYEYLGIINDDIAGSILDKVLEHGFFKTRGYQLMHQFGIKI
jgi:hypothetical protein